MSIFLRDILPPLGAPLAASVSQIDARKGAVKAHSTLMSEKLTQPTLTALRNDAIELPRLELVISPLEGPVFATTLEVAPRVLGTGSECDVIVADPRVSRRHCEVALTERGVMIKEKAGAAWWF